MAIQTIGIGTVADDGTGDSLRAAGDKINDNFNVSTDIKENIENRPQADLPFNKIKSVNQTVSCFMLPKNQSFIKRQLYT